MQKRSRRISIWATIICFMLSVMTGHAGTARKGEIQFSDGENKQGLLSLSANRMLKIHDGKTLRTIDLADVVEIRIEPEREKMERKWRFVEAGRTEKAFSGEPYPVRHLRTVIAMSQNTSITGHLYTTVMYVEQPEKTSKVVISAKLRGKEGQSFDDLVYPIRISFTDAVRRIGSDAEFEILRADGKRIVDVRAITYPTLFRMKAARSADNTFRLTRLLDPRIFLAVRGEEEINIGWPENDPELFTNISNAMHHVREFFDQQRLIGVYREADSNDAYSLIMLFRRGKTSLNASRSQPWRLGLWRWKYETGKEPMVAARSYFFRGIEAKGGKPLPVRICAELWGLDLKTASRIEIPTREQEASDKK